MNRLTRFVNGMTKIVDEAKVEEKILARAKEVSGKCAVERAGEEGKRKIRLRTGAAREGNGLVGTRAGG